MMLLVESNFIIELAAQEEVDQAELLVQSAEKQEYRLFIPAFSLAEAFETYARWRKQRNQSRNDFDAQLRQLARSRDHADLANATRTIADVFSASAIAQAKRLNETLTRLIRCATVLPLDERVIARSIEAQEDFGLEAKDAVVFASVEAGLTSAEDEDGRLFITKDRSGFLRPQVVDHFRALRCDVVPAIGPALGRVKQAGVGAGARPV